MSMSLEKQSEYIQEDEIDLRELWQTIKKGKKVIIAFVIVITSFTLLYVLSKPNVYESKVVLIPSSDNQGSSMGSLGGLAALAGVSMGGGSMTPDVAFSSLVENKSFMREFVIKNKIFEHYSAEDFDKNYVFALGLDWIYKLKRSTPKEPEGEVAYEAAVYGLVSAVQSKISIASDKKSELITISYQDSDPTYPPVVLEAFMRDATEYLVKNNLRIIENKLGYFQNELQKAEGYELRQSISSMISKIIEEKVVTQSKEYYQCDVLTYPHESYVKDKIKPKRGLIVVVAMVTSVILGIFFIFFREFLNSKQEDEIESA